MTTMTIVFGHANGAYSTDVPVILGTVYGQRMFVHTYGLTLKLKAIEDNYPYTDADQYEWSSYLLGGKEIQFVMIADQSYEVEVIYRKEVK